MKLLKHIVYLNGAIDQVEDQAKKYLEYSDFLNRDDDFYDYRQMEYVVQRLCSTEMLHSYLRAVTTLSDMRAHWTDSNYRKLNWGTDSYVYAVYLLNSSIQTIRDVLKEVETIVDLVSTEIE